MSDKSLYYLSTGFFGTVGGFIPMLWGGSAWGVASIITSTLAGIFGLWIAYRYLHN